MCASPIVHSHQVYGSHTVAVHSIPKAHELLQLESCLHSKTQLVYQERLLLGSHLKSYQSRLCRRGVPPKSAFKRKGKRRRSMCKIFEWVTLISMVATEHLAP